jgi:catechol 2,3-dioxygenase-like lactoylglutathione lyase family enzyme
VASGRRVAAFAIVIPDYDAAIDFYVNQAGFVLIEDTRLSPDKRWVLVAPAQDAESCWPAPTALHRRQPSATRPAGVWASFCTPKTSPATMRP